jgi:ribosome-binding protein aMBF1 (putative translation factor)
MTLHRGDRHRSVTLSRLVAEVYLGPPPGTRAWVQHKDGDPMNCSADNLAWSTAPPKAKWERRSHEEKTALARAIKLFGLDSVVEWSGVPLTTLRHLTPGKVYAPRDRRSKAPLLCGVPPKGLDEEWRQAPGHEGYDVSSHGRVRSYRLRKSTILRPQMGTSGYLGVRLRGKSIAVHRLVAEVFCPRGKKNVVNHIDGDKHNNWATNLEWVTSSENAQHAHALGLWQRVSTPGRGGRPTPTEVSEMRAEGLSAGEIAERFRTAPVVIEALEQGKPWALTIPIEGERWAPLSGFFVDVSDHGRVRSSRFDNKLIMLRPNDSGYIIAALPQREGGFKHVRIHRAVITAFGESPPSPRHVVNHKNCVRDDNRLCNLEWVTSSENAQHAHAAGRHPHRERPKEPLSRPTDTEEETFREVRKGFWVSNLGRVVSGWRKHPREMQSTKASAGARVKIEGKEYWVAHLVADAFGQPRPALKHTRQRSKKERPLSQPRSRTKGKLASPEALALVREVAEGRVRQLHAAQRLNVTHNAIAKAVKRLLAGQDALPP